jgi:hypothetical protein
MADEPVPPMAVAMQWVARVFAASAVMVLPGLGGTWLDGRWGMRFLGPAGFVFGLVGGVVYLIAVTRQAEVARRRDADEGARQEHRGRGPRPPQQ